MQTISIPQQAAALNSAPANENRIMARVVLQVWGGRKGNDAITDCEKHVDVTDAILLLERDFVVGLKDGEDQTDELGYAHVNHSGPLEVYVTSSICDFFGVDRMEDITSAAFAEARRVVNPKPPEFVRTVVEMEVTAKVLPGGDRDRALEDLLIEVASPSENVVVTNVQRKKPASDRPLAMPAADPKLPRFMQLLALCNAVTIDDGAVLTDWTKAEWSGEPTNEVLRFAWTDGEFNYSMVLTEEGIESGTFDDLGRFFTIDQEGTLVMVRLFKLDAIGPAALATVH